MPTTVAASSTSPSPCAPLVAGGQRARDGEAGAVGLGVLDGRCAFAEPTVDVLRDADHAAGDGVELVGLVGEVVHALAAAAACRRRPVWWRELEVLLVAYSGLRWDEHAALTAGQIDPRRRRITVDRQVIETRSALKVALPKGRRLRVTMYPAATPAGLDLAELLERRLAELGDGDLVFPVPQGAFLRRSNYGRSIWDPAATSVGWPRHNRRWAWTFHSLRHVFATCALNPTWTAPRRRFPPLRSQPTRVTQDVYIHVHGDLYQRFYDATA